ncbi:serine hydrolase domain-containing protein [Dinghuibacter silviterrae]|uniref:CubicO group peptidase (Beta-lactamase class C family) n=1 Tax=Dinghuibacter silviterrae TaxID=1539049 RepID=A0A4R8DF60_9BACT|nr:serine hydrolase domain-containing protein [Dinghuibacter silviterrae]TDW96223.1 CubicO group peptidase (beta-lactamase class C family) [Dinghuibacter silviterrae]
MHTLLYLLLDSLISLHFQGNVPGMAVLVAQKGQVLFEKAYGSANIELETPLEPSMAFKIGSVTKQFTAVGILRLVDQGRVHLSDTIQQYIKGFPSKGYPITIENLLTHTSGIVDYMSLDDPDPYIERRDFTPEQIIHYFQDRPLLFRPGFTFSYSNSNYTLLGYIIQKVTGMPYHLYMTDSVLKPAGLTHTGFATEQDVLPGRVEGYSRDKGYYQNADYQSMTLAYAAGDLYSTVEDLYRWNCALLEGKLLPPSLLQKAWTAHRLADSSSTHYGYGWYDNLLYGVRCIHHEGQINGFIAEVKYFPGEDLYVCTLTNLRSGEDRTTFSEGRFRLMENIALAALGKLGPPPASLPSGAIDRFIGSYRCVEKPKLVLKIYKENGRLYADLSNGTGRHMVLEPETATRFVLPDVLNVRTTIEFTPDGGLIATQDKPYVFKKF